MHVISRRVQCRGQQLSHVDQGHYLRIYVRQLRQKLENEPAKPRYLINVTGIGYRLLSDADFDNAWSTGSF